ncbi:MAG UNVERIFIED_CONTAM: SMP-30/gluconolactonase/LRE family protein [Microcystis novacekii LVE1205-3]|jgi:ligand-binding sensor domain-containing protein
MQEEIWAQTLAPTGITLSDFDLAFDPQGNLWATTGGNGLLKLNAETGAIVKNYGESITQTLAIDAATGTIYVSSANGVEIFDPTKESFSHFSDIRVGNLAFDNQGNLWGATWQTEGILSALISGVKRKKC